MQNFDEILKKLLEIEKKYNLFNILDENWVPKWIFLRWQFMSLYFFWESNHNFINTNNKSKLPWFIKRSFFWFFKFLFNFLKYKKIKNIVLIPEKSIYNYKNLHSLFIEDFLNTKEDILFLEIPTNHTNKWRNIKHKNYLALDFLFWLKLFYFFIYSFLNKNKNEFKEVFSLLKEEDRKKIQNDYLYKEASRKFAIFLKNTLFKWKKIYHVWDILGFQFINSSEVIEIQFWLFNKMRYTFPNNKNINIFLQNEKILIYQDYLIDELIKNWYKKENLIKIEKKPEIYSFIKYFWQNKVKKSWKKKILIIEQPFSDRYKILEKLFNIINNNNFNNINFGFKKHPNSYKNYDFLEKLWIKFHWNNNHIYEVLLEYDYIITVDSTVIFEASQFWLWIITIFDEKDIYFDNVKNLLWHYKNYRHLKIENLEKELRNIS